MNQLTEKHDVAQTVQSAVDYSFYLWHLVKEKPVMVAIGTVVSAVATKVLPVLPDHMVAVMALSILCMIDWFTKRDACLARGIPFTSKLMREKGVMKLRDYLLLYIAGAMTIPLTGDTWVYRSTAGFIAICELWSVAENLHDAGRLPFDIRQLAVFSSIRKLMKGDKNVETAPRKGTTEVSKDGDQ